MKGQMTLEFLVILFILVSYLSVVFALFSSSKESLELAVDRKLVSRVVDWVEFISSRPDGTEIKFELTPFPRHFLCITCGNQTILETPMELHIINISSSCNRLNLTDTTCLSIISRGGVDIEVC